jgi:hypothetical protein
MNPEQVLAREALDAPARTYVSPEDRQDAQMQKLSATLRELIRQAARLEADKR